MSVKNWFNAVPLSVRRVFTALLVLMLLAVPAQSAQAGAPSPAALVKDILLGPNSSDPQYFAVFNNKLYFRGTDSSSHEGLWMYDFTTGTAEAVPNSVDANTPKYLTVYDGKLYFAATDNKIAGGNELWSYDGINPPSMVANLNPTNWEDSNPSYLTVYNGALYFSANAGTNSIAPSKGGELWKYDGSAFSLAADIKPGAGGSFIGYLTVFNGALYFSADGGTNPIAPNHGQELWMYDGSSASLAKDIRDVSVGSATSDSSYISELTAYDGKLYFTFNGWDGHGQELWKFDGTNAPTLAADINTNGDSEPSSLAVYNGALYFEADDGTHGPELWKYNGSSATLAADINTNGDFGSYPDYLMAYNGALYFQADDGTSTTGVELWKFDGISPAVTANSLQTSYSGTGPSSFTITFNEEIYNPEGNTDAEDVTNPANFLLVEKGANKTIDTVSCAGGVKPDDIQVTVASVTYANPTATVTLSAPLPIGDYQLFVCATTSIVDLFGNPINGGVDLTYNLTVGASPASSVAAGSSGSKDPKNLPATGFAPNLVTSLPAQPAALAYTQMSGLWLEIPSQKVQANIVGVPEVNSNWDVSWLGKDTGWLSGSAYPTWNGNSVLTAHVTDANGLPGPFANLKNLAYGNKLVVHLYGEKYTYEVRDSRLVFPDTTAYAFEHLKDHSYLTLITCQGYNFLTNDYMFRRVVRAVLVSVTAE